MAYQNIDAVEQTQTVEETITTITVFTQTTQTSISDVNGHIKYKLQDDYTTIPCVHCLSITRTP